jgi:hypothetical protein
MTNKKALALPDALLVRYFRGGEIEHIRKVTTHADGRIEVQLRTRTDWWRDLGGGLGIVPDAD